MSNKIVGNTVGIPNPITDYAQNDPAKADYIKNRPFKPIPEGMTIDDLKDVWQYGGCYLLGTADDFEKRCDLLYVCGGWYVDEGFGDVATTCQTRFVWDGFEYKIQTRKMYDSGWSAWEDCFGTGGGELETIATVNIEEEVNDITITADSQGNPFELKELFAYIQIPAVADGIQPIIYFGSENTCNRTLDNLTVDSSIVIKWKREEMVAEIQVYNYGTNKFKNLTILKVSDTNIVNKLRLYHKTQLYPIGTSITLKGKRV